MAEKVKVVELEGIKLTPGAKYLFLVHPIAADIRGGLVHELSRLIGKENFTVGVIDPTHLKVYEVMPEDKK